VRLKASRCWLCGACCNAPGASDGASHGSSGAWRWFPPPSLSLWCGMEVRSQWGASPPLSSLASVRRPCARVSARRPCVRPYTRLRRCAPADGMLQKTLAVQAALSARSALSVSLSVCDHVRSRSAGVVVGDRSAHAPVRHLAQLLYFALFSGACLAPVLLAPDM
jgi:DIE2/ALG10 family